GRQLDRFQEGVGRGSARGGARGGRQEVARTHCSRGDGMNRWDIPHACMTKIRKLGRVKTAWLAGFLDGEGSFMCILVSGRRSRRGKKYYALRVTAAQKGKELLQRVQRYVGGGHIYRTPGWYSANMRIAGWNPTSGGWAWQLQSRYACPMLMKKLYPHMSRRRRRQIRTALRRAGVIL